MWQGDRKREKGERLNSTDEYGEGRESFGAMVGTVNLTPCEALKPRQKPRLEQQTTH